MNIEIPYKDILAIIGILSLIFGFIKLLFEVLPQLNQIKSKFWKFLSNKIRYKKLEKKAISSNIESVVNEVVVDLQKELPKGWINKTSIQWVEKDIPDELNDEELILRIKPVESQDSNLIKAVFYFFSKSLFPGTKEIIPKSIRKASVLQLSRRTINEKQPYIIKKFESDYIENTIQTDQNVARYIGDFSNIDKQGFFTGTYLREIHDIADNQRYSELRTRIEDEFNNILLHIKNFTNRPSNAPEELWFRKGEANSYAFLLVAKPYHISVNPYLKRSKERYSDNIKRLYVMGANQEKLFVKKVIKKISRKTKYNLVELFKLHKDYRGESGGVGAVFDHETQTKKNEEVVNKFFNNE